MLLFDYFPLKNNKTTWQPPQLKIKYTEEIFIKFLRHAEVYNIGQSNFLARKIFTSKETTSKAKLVTAFAIN